MHPEALEDLRGLSVHRAPVDPPTRAQRLPADEDVLRDRQVRELHGLLVDDRDARLTCVHGARQHAIGTVDADGAPVGEVHAREDLDERRLAGAVLAHECVCLAALQVNRDVLERMNGAKGFRRVVEGEDRGRRRVHRLTGTCRLIEPARPVGGS